LDDRRNMILAVALSMLVFLGWNLIAQTYFPPPKRPVVAAPSTNPGAPLPTLTTVPAPAPKIAIPDAKAVVGQNPRIKIDTPRLSGSINLRGARIDDLLLTTYRDTIEKNAPPVRLLAPLGSKNSYYSGFGWLGDGVAVPGPNTLWSADRATLTPTAPVTLSWDNQQGQRFTVKIAVDKDFMFTVDQAVTNNGTAPIISRPFAFASRDHVSADPASNSHIGPLGVFNGVANYDVTYDVLTGKDPSFFAKIFGTSAKSGENAFTSKGGWLGFGDKYWLVALIPSQESKVDAAFRFGTGIYQSQFATAPVTVTPGSTSQFTTRMFAGAKEVALLDRYESDLKIHNFGRAIDWGWFEIIEKPIFYLLDWLFKFIGNFGVAIMLLTLVVRGAMFPIAQRQFASMAAMRVVQPKLKALQERFKDDKVKLQSAMVELYKTEKINPVAGCLPLLLQIPIFFALYKVLSITIEMRHQPFVLWIRDLSAPDPANIVALAHMASIPLPQILSIGVLGVLLGVTMYFQFKLSPAPADPAQAQVMAIMPWMMMFMMGSFASGLLIYWSTSNLLTIAQQKLLYSRYPGLKEPVKT
jgi:YidC/Oxa1 family membrane protein insertase